MPTLAGKPRSERIKPENRVTKGSINATQMAGWALTSCCPVCSTDKRWTRAFSTYPSDQVTTYSISLIPLSPLPPPPHLPTKSPCRVGSPSNSSSPPLSHHCSFLTCQPDCLDSNPWSPPTMKCMTLARYLASLWPRFLTCKMEVVSGTALTGILWGLNSPVSRKHSDRGTEEVPWSCEL